ncbi:putative TatD related DNase [Trypanosoma vivax]|uniref:TatD related DNase n=1 Tax=Trypanosoma vivax (strain Y486) TaxID=1055687 RepID=G0TST0_TRYVY|nr:putative TatD related DNase [Trypanosoma vivax]CCC47008.1 conserved hypothetical protein [Trypanosoma vivax Y486]
MGFVDRGGGREAKGASLRRSKKNPGAPAARQASSAKVNQQQQPAVRMTPVPPPIGGTFNNIDASVCILSRKLGGDHQELMLRAAQESEVAAALTWCGIFEQQEMLIDACRHHNATVPSANSDTAGRLYCTVGVHVNSVDRTHKQQHEKWLESVCEMARNSEVLAVLSGLNLTRDSSTHFSQERLLRGLWKVAGALRMPIVLHICYELRDSGAKATQDEDCSDDAAYTGGSCGCVGNQTVDRAAELLSELIFGSQEEGEKGGGGQTAPECAPTAVVLHNGLGVIACSPAMRALAKKCVPVCTPTSGPPPLYVLATAEGLTGSDSPTYRSAFADALCESVSLSQLLVGTGAPWNTPQNIPDEYVRSMPNEPANYRYVVAAIREVLKNGHCERVPGEKELCTIVRDNFLRVFFNAEPDHVEHEQLRCEDDHETTTAVESKLVKKAPPLEQRAHFDPSVVSSTDTLRKCSNSTRSYLCLKCRRTLFHERSLLTHSPDDAQAHFTSRQQTSNKKKGTKGKQSVLGSCDSVYFLTITVGGDGEWLVEESGVVVHRGNASVSCSGCGAKLGTASENCSCACGCTVHGLTARLVASRVEPPVDKARGTNLEELLLQAAREREGLATAVDDQTEAEGGTKQRTRGPKKNVKANNRSNFTHFRNKNFAPKQLAQQGVDGSEIGGAVDHDSVEGHSTDSEQSSYVVHNGRRRCRRRNGGRSRAQAVCDASSESGSCST